MLQTRRTVEDVGDVALDWCTDDDISYEEEQKYASGGDVAVLLLSGPPAEQQYSSSFVGRTSRRNGVIAISGIPT